MENIYVYWDVTVNSLSEVHKLPGNQCGLVALGAVMGAFSSSLSGVAMKLGCFTRRRYLKTLSFSASF